MKQSDDNKFIPMTSVESGNGYPLTDDIYYYTNQIVNVIFVGKDPDNWVMIDAGMPKSARELKEVAEKRYGKGSRPKAILLTHGHFDHIGSVVDLIKEWNVTVYAHRLEFPYLTGKTAYPDPDTTVEGGMLAKMSFLYPHEPIDIHEALLPLPTGGTVPMLPHWEWIHTPGHSPGHVSFFRAEDKTLIAGDAFITVRADSFYKVLLQKEEVNGPPRYLTIDWNAAYHSVVKLAKLNPERVITGHGKAMHGQALRDGLQRLAEQFNTIAVPEHGKYIPDDAAKRK
jgi:glyoxylase-like metal-dependent hydrolase (beta-lactamase superfamily II)